MNKFLEAMKAGQSRFRTLSDKSGTQFYVALAAAFGVTLIELAYAYQSRRVTDAIIAVIIGFIVAPVFSWFWFRRRLNRGPR